MRRDVRDRNRIFALRSRRRSGCGHSVPVPAALPGRRPGSARLSVSRVGVAGEGCRRQGPRKSLRTDAGLSTPRRPGEIERSPGVSCRGKWGSSAVVVLPRFPRVPRRALSAHPPDGDDVVGRRGRQQSRKGTVRARSRRCCVPATCSGESDGGNRCRRPGVEAGRWEWRPRCGCSAASFGVAEQGSDGGTLGRCTVVVERCRTDRTAVPSAGDTGTSLIRLSLPGREAGTRSTGTCSPRRVAPIVTGKGELGCRAWAESFRVSISFWRRRGELRVSRPPSLRSDRRSGRAARQAEQQARFPGCNSNL